MATVYIGSAAIDERGKATGGVAGDQTGRELRTQKWYKHSLGWVVIRAKSTAVRKKIAAAMRAACLNAKIGYDQYQRDTLYNASKPLGFDPAKVTTPCECDCSSLVRVCLAYAGIMVGSFRTYNEPAVLKATKQFDVLTDRAYTDYPDQLMEGDILCTPASGHTVVVLNDGDLVQPVSGGGGGGGGSAPAPAPNPNTLPLLKLRLFHMRGSAVKLLQTELLKWNSKCLPKYGADGDFGKETDAAVRAYQKANRLEVDGIVGPITWKSLLT